MMVKIEREYEIRLALMMKALQGKEPLFTEETVVNLALDSFLEGAGF